MTAVFLVPLIALVLVRYVEGSLTGTRFVVALTVLLAFQISFSTELAFTLTLALAVSLALAAILVPASRRRLRLMLPPLVISYVAAALLTSPLLAYALLHVQHGALHPPGAYPADLLNLVIPTRLTALGWSWTTVRRGQLQGHPPRRAPTSALRGSRFSAGSPGAFGVWQRRVPRRAPCGRCRRRARDPSHGGRPRLVALPWRLVPSLPLFDNILPVRISMFVAARRERVRRVVGVFPARATPARPLTGLAIVTVVPSLWLSVWHQHPYRPAFFAQGTYRTCLAPDNVLMLPFHSDEMLSTSRNRVRLPHRERPCHYPRPCGRARAATRTLLQRPTAERPANAPRMGAQDKASRRS